MAQPIILSVLFDLATNLCDHHQPLRFQVSCLSSL